MTPAPSDAERTAARPRARWSGSGSRPSARDLVEKVVDRGTFHSWDAPVVDPRRGEGYAAELEAARARSGVDEAVLTGEAEVGGRRVALVACEFSFLAGSIGLAAADRLVRGIERATAERLPLLAGPASGGTRMQEGTLAFVSMVRITAAVTAHRREGLPYLVYLRHPTTGGVLASWGSLGHLTAAEPGALVGFLGPRVYEAIHGRSFPAGTQVSENLYRHGLVDAVLSPDQLAGTVHRVLDVLLPGRPELVEPPETLGFRPPATPAWTSIRISRRPERPGVRELLRRGAGDVSRLSGTGEGEKGRGILLALARFGGVSCVVVGQDRRAGPGEAALGPAALREARRGIGLSRELRLPLVTVVDTAGAALSEEAEEGGLAGEIARCLQELLTHPEPTVSVLLGQGAGGGAIAFLPADRTLAAQHAWLSPLPPEGASAIVHRTVDRAADMAEDQQVGAVSLLENGIVDHVIDERPDAADEPEAFCERLAAALGYELQRLSWEDVDELQRCRVARYDRLGAVSR